MSDNMKCLVVKKVKGGSRFVDKFNTRVRVVSVIGDSEKSITIRLCRKQGKLEGSIYTCSFDKDEEGGVRLVGCRNFYPQ